MTWLKFMVLDLSMEFEKILLPSASVNAPQVLSFFLSPMFSNPCYFFFFYPLPPFSQNGFSLASLI